MVQGQAGRTTCCTAYFCFPAPRFVYESAKLAHTLIWHQEKFKWGTAILFE